MEKPLADLDAEVEEQLVALAIALARQIIHREIRLHPEAITLVVREDLESLPMARRNTKIVLHPEDLPLVLAALGESERGIRLLEDPALSRGGCRVETDNSRIDATLEQRIHQVLARLLDGQPAAS